MINTLKFNLTLLEIIFMYMCSIHLKYFSLVIRRIKQRGVKVLNPMRANNFTELVSVLNNDDDDLLKKERGYSGN